MQPRWSGGSASLWQHLPSLPCPTLPTLLQSSAQVPVLPVAKPGVRARQAWLLLIGFVLGQVQAIPTWSQGKGPILAEL